MINYILYKSEYEECDCIAEVLNENENEILSVQKQLVSKGYLIEKTVGRFIKCRKISD